MNQRWNGVSMYVSRILYGSVQLVLNVLKTTCVYTDVNDDFKLPSNIKKWHHEDQQQARTPFWTALGREQIYSFILQFPHNWFNRMAIFERIFQATQCEARHWYSLKFSEKIWSKFLRSMTNCWKHCWLPKKKRRKSLANCTLFIRTVERSFH